MFGHLWMYEIFGLTEKNTSNIDGHVSVADYCYILDSWEIYWFLVVLCGRVSIVPVHNIPGKLNVLIFFFCFLVLDPWRRMIFWGSICKNDAWIHFSQFLIWFWGDLHIAIEFELRIQCCIAEGKFRSLDRQVIWGYPIPDQTKRTELFFEDMDYGVAWKLSEQLGCVEGSRSSSDDGERCFFHL